MVFCMCWGVETPFVRNYTHTHTIHTLFFPAAASAAHPELPTLNKHYSASIPLF